MKKILIVCWIISIKSIILFCSFLFSLNVYPPRHEVFLAPNEEKEVRFTVVNTNDFETKVFITSSSWHVLEENKNIDNSLWFNYQPQQFVLKPKEEKEVICNIRCPQQAVGFLNMMLSFTEDYKYADMITLIISVPVYLIVKGSAFFSIDITSFTYTYNPLTNTPQIIIELKNDGNVYIRPSGKLEILKGKQKVYSYEFEEIDVVFPKTKGVWLFNCEKDLLDKKSKYKLILDLDMWGNKAKLKKKLVFKNGLWILK